MTCTIDELQINERVRRIKVKHRVDEGQRDRLVCGRAEYKLKESLINSG